MLPRDLVIYLRQQGHEAYHVHSLGVVGTTDEGIWKVAEDKRAILISKDSDFEKMAERSVSAQLIHIKTGNQSTVRLLEDFKQQLPRLLTNLANGTRICVLS